MIGPARIERSSVERKDQNVIIVNVKARRATTVSASTGRAGQREKEAMKTKPPPTQPLLPPSSIAHPVPKTPSQPSPPSENSVPIQSQASCPHTIPVQNTCILLSQLPIGTISQQHNSAGFEINLRAHIRPQPIPAWRALLSPTPLISLTAAIITLCRTQACHRLSRAHKLPSPTIPTSTRVLVQLLQIIEQRSYVSALPWSHKTFVQRTCLCLQTTLLQQDR